MGEILWNKEDSDWLVQWPDVLRLIEDIPPEPGHAAPENGDPSRQGLENGMPRHRDPGGLSELIGFLRDTADPADRRTELITLEFSARGGTISDRSVERRDVDGVRPLVVSAIRGDVADLIRRLLRLARAEREIRRGNAYRDGGTIYLVAPKARLDR